MHLVGHLLTQNCDARSHEHNKIVALTKQGRSAFTFTPKTVGFYFFFRVVLTDTRVYPSASSVLWDVRACEPGNNKCIRRNTL